MDLVVGMGEGAVEDMVQQNDMEVELFEMKLRGNQVSEQVQIPMNPVVTWKKVKWTLKLFLKRGAAVCK